MAAGVHSRAARERRVSALRALREGGNVKTMLAGLAMLAFGGTLMFGHVEALPLWLCWTAGPLCWYAGFGVTGAGIVMRAWKEFSVTQQPEEARPVVAEAPRRKETVLVHRFVRVNGGPVGVEHEIPAMGGFIN